VLFGRLHRSFAYFFSFPTVHFGALVSHYELWTEMGSSDSPSPSSVFALLFDWRQEGHQTSRGPASGPTTLPLTSNCSACTTGSPFFLLFYLFGSVLFPFQIRSGPVQGPGAPVPAPCLLASWVPFDVLARISFLYVRKGRLPRSFYLPAFFPLGSFLDCVLYVTGRPPKWIVG